MFDRSAGVSCLCPTYGRPHLLEEGIESFLRQDWPGPKELIVLNDHPQQQLIFEHENVLIINLPRRLRTLGEKRNLTAALANYDNLLLWDDDDIHLPWRISETMKRLPQAAFFKCPNAWQITNGVWQRNLGHHQYHAAAGYTRSLFETLRGYRCIDHAEDTDFELRLAKLSTNGDKKAAFRPTLLSKDRIYYIYRWGHGSYHVTNHMNISEINPDVKAGEILLLPHWNWDYTALARNAASQSGRRVGSASDSVSVHQTSELR